MSDDTGVRGPVAAAVSGELWQQLADNIPQLAWVAGPDGAIHWYNQRWYEYTGTDFAGMQGWGWKAIHHPEHVDRVVERFTAAITSGQPWEDVFPLRGATGEYRQFLSRAQPIRDEAGAITHWFGTNTDITEQLAAEERAREAHERVQLALDAGAIIGTWHWDLTCDRFTVDEQFALHFGLDPALGRSGLSLEQVIETVHPDDEPGLRAAIADVVAGGGHYAHQYRVLRRDGRYYWVEANGRVDKSADGTPLRFPGVLIDVQSRREVEDSLRLSEAEARQAAQEIAAIYETAPIGLTILNPELRYVRINDRLAEINGLPAADHIGRSVREVVPGIADEAEAVLARVLQGEEIWGLELSGETAALPGVSRTRRENWIPIRNADGAVSGIAISAEEITESKAAERALQESEAQFRGTAEALPGMLFVTDAEGKNLYINDFYRRYVGLDEGEVLGAGWSDVVHPDDLPAVEAESARARAQGGPFGLDYRLRRHDGAWRWHSTRATPIAPPDGEANRWVGVSLDVHDRREAEERLREAETRYRRVFESAAIGVGRVSRESLPRDQRPLLPDSRAKPGGASCRRVGSHHAPRRPGRGRGAGESPASRGGGQLSLREALPWP